MAEALAEDEKTSEAAECYQKLDDLSAELLDSDDYFQQRYWHDILAGLAGCHVALDNLDAVGNIYRRALDHEFQALEELVGEYPNDGRFKYYRALEVWTHPFTHASSATAKLMSVWIKQQKFFDTVDLMKALDRGDTGYIGTRLAAVFQANAHDSEFQAQIRELTSAAHAFEFVDKAYKSAIDITDAWDVNRSVALQFSRGMLAWLCGSSTETQDRAFEMWTGIVKADVLDDVSDGDSIEETRANAARALLRTLLERAKEFGPGSRNAGSIRSSVRDRSKSG